MFAAAEVKLWQRPLYWVFNSLIIFAVGSGAHSLGAGAAKQVADLMRPEVAYAQSLRGSGNGPVKFEAVEDPERLKRRLEQFRENNERLKRIEEKLDRLEAQTEAKEPVAKPKAPPARDRSFFGGDWTFGSSRDR